MSDIRQRLADALNGHGWVLGNTRCQAGCGFPTRNGDDWRLHVADALLSLPGITIVDAESVLKEHRCIDSSDRYLSTCLSCSRCNMRWPCEVVKLLAAAHAAEADQ
jgi:hypothetical protein